MHSSDAILHCLFSYGLDNTVNATGHFLQNYTSLSKLCRLFQEKLFFRIQFWANDFQFFIVLKHNVANPDELEKTGR